MYLQFQMQMVQHTHGAKAQFMEKKFHQRNLFHMMKQKYWIWMLFMLKSAKMMKLQEHTQWQIHYLHHLNLQAIKFFKLQVTQFGVVQILILYLYMTE